MTIGKKDKNRFMDDSTAVGIYNIFESWHGSSLKSDQRGTDQGSKESNKTSESCQTGESGQTREEREDSASRKSV